MADVTVAGQVFHLRRLASTRILRFARLAMQGVSDQDVEALVAIDQLFEKALAPEDRERFDDACDDAELSFEGMMEIVAVIIAEATARPTSGPSDSSDGQLSTSGSSADGSSSAVITRLEAQGRPSIAYMVQQADRARLSSVSA